VLPVDGELRVTTPLLEWRGKRLSDVRLLASARDLLLHVDEFSGDIYGGRLNIAGRVDPAARAFAGTVLLSAADLKSALTDLAAADAISGRGDVAAGLAGHGDSWADLIGTLAGEVRFAAREGEVAGFDVSAVGDRIKRTSRATGILELARAGVGGRTRYSRADGTFKIEHGIARTRDFRVIARGGEARLTGTINLPAWRLDMVNEIGVTDPPDAPPVVVKLNGPLQEPRSVVDFQRLQSYLMRRSAP
jgi:uncharacterized protein involved in outer membrane biogenesis